MEVCDAKEGELLKTDQRDGISTAQQAADKCQ
jgi:hypothetical protein